MPRDSDAAQNQGEDFRWKQAMVLYRLAKQNQKHNLSNDSFGLSSKEGDKDSPPPIKPGNKKFGSPAANQQRFDNTVFLSNEPRSANVTD